MARKRIYNVPGIWFNQCQGGIDMAEMEFGKLCAPTLKELFVREMEGSILSGRLPVGAKLPTERELSEMMQVSRAVVNAGLSEMERKGFLTVKPRSGTFVADYRRNGTAETLVSIMSYNGGMLGRAEIKSILEFRMVLDTLAVRLLIPRIDSAGLAALADHVLSLKETDSPSKAAEIAFNFHHELGILCGNTLLPLIFYSFKYPIINLWERYCLLYGVGSLADNTAGLFERIRDRDIEKAIEYITATLNESIEGSRTIYYE